MFSNLAVMTQHRYFLLNKPYNMVSQFVSTHDVGLLGDIDFDFPEGTHAIGRLDNHSEGLLLLTTNKKVTKLLFQGEQPHQRTYLVLVKYKVSEATLEQLRTGVAIQVKGGGMYTSAPCQAEIVTNPGIHFESPYIMTNYIDYTWLKLTLTEGKFHQVRKMVAAAHHRCKRLIRTAIEDLNLGDLPPGAVQEIPEQEFFDKLHIRNWQ
jgi:23S rRNA pseudouridine2457 synthase